MGSARIQERRALDRFVELCKIDSESYHESKIAAYCISLLESLGFSIYADDSQEATGSDSPNILAVRPGELPGRIVLCAHLDTVSPGRGVVPVVCDDGIVRSAGDTVLGADDKVGLMGILEAIQCAVEAHEEVPTIGVLLTVCEERGLIGAASINGKVAQILGADAPEGFAGSPCIVFDSEHSPGTVIVGSPCKHDFVATFHGRAAHAGVEPQEGVSAIAMAADAVCQMDVGRLNEKTTANIGTINGGEADNIVPDTCTMTGECRSLDESMAAQVKADMQDAMQQAADRAGGSVDVQWKQRYASLVYSEDDPLVEMLMDAAHRAGLEGNLGYTGGGADSNVLGRLGVKPITVCTGMTNYHSLDEYVIVSDLYGCARFALECIRLSAVSS